MLTQQLATATAGITVPVGITAAPATNATKAAAAAQVAGATNAVRASQQLDQSARIAAASQAKLANATTILATAEKRAAAATTEVAAAQTRYAATVRATGTTFAAYQKSLEATDFLLVKQTRDAYAAAKANEALALSALNAAKAERAQAAELAAANASQAASLGQLSRGAGGAALALGGLRGATLASTGPFLAGVAAITAFSKALQTATDFSSQISVLGATTGAAGEEMQRAAEAAREFGRDITLPGVTAGDAAQTITEFAKAGLTLNDSLAATRGGLQLAQAAQLPYAEAVTLTANALNAFGLQGDQAVRVADVLANAANNAQGNIGDMALALRQSAGAAAVVGVSFEDTASLLTLLAKNGLTGSDAGTALRTAFLRLVNPSEEAKDVLESLNVQLRDIDGNVRPEIFAEFANAQRDLTAAQQQANAAIVFGQDAFRAFGFLGREGVAGLSEVRRALDEQGTAAEIAAARMTGLRGAQENLSNQLNDFGLTVGQIVDGPMTGLVNVLANTISVANTAAGSIVDLGQAIAGLSLPERPPGTDSFLGNAFDIFGDSRAGSANPIVSAFRLITNQGEEEGKNAADSLKGTGVLVRDALESTARVATQNAQASASAIREGLTAWGAQVNQAIRDAAAEARAGALQAVSDSQGVAAGLGEALDRIVAGGGNEQTQIANLRRQAEAQARIIRDAGPDAAGVLLEARREAQSRLAAINSQIKSINEGITRDAEQAAEERKREQEEQARLADQGVLDRQALARQAAENRVTVAGDTPSLQDDINRAQALRALIQRQIAQVRDRITDERARQQAVAALTQQVFVTTQALQALKDAQRKQQEENRQAIFDQTQENASLRTQIAEARGNESAVILFINEEIRLAQIAVRRAKQAGKGILQATLELEQLRKKKRDLLQQAEDDADEDAVGGTSLVDLFNRAEEIARGAGNVGFTTAGLQGIRAQPRIAAEVQERIDIVQGRSPVESFRGAADRLVTAIEQLTETIQQSGNSSTVGPRGGLNGRSPQWESLTQEQRFFYQKQAKQMVDHGLVGRSGI